jgi:hypothetical protein
LQIVPYAHECLIECQTGLNANDHKVKQAGKPSRIRCWQRLIIRFRVVGSSYICAQ